MSEFHDQLDLSSATTSRAPAGVSWSVPCVYCRGSIPASTFSALSTARRLLSASCPECERRVTLATSTWRRWLKKSIA